MKDFLPQQIPDARIMTFGYNADVVYTRASSARITLTRWHQEDFIPISHKKWRHSIRGRDPKLVDCYLMKRLS